MEAPRAAPMEAPLAATPQQAAQQAEPAPAAAQAATQAGPQAGPQADGAPAEASLPEEELRAQMAAEMAQAESDETIVVTGDAAPVTVRQVQRQARDIAVRTGHIFSAPLARFEDRLCAGVFGIEDRLAARMIDRVRANAAALGIRVQGDGCHPNFIIGFSDDGEAMLRRMMRQRPEDFEFLNLAQKSAILEPGPVHVWTHVEPRTLTGMPIPQVRNMVAPPQMQVFGAHSRIYTTIRQDITGVFVVFDRDAVRGLELWQLADYATMRGLAQTRPTGDLAIDTILALFAPAPDLPGWAPPRRLTDFDLAYLRTLYDYIPNLPAARKLAEVGLQMRRMAEENASPPPPPNRPERQRR